MSISSGTPGTRGVFRNVNGVRLHCVEAGPPDARTVILLHGFPDFWYSWRHQLPALAAAGLHAIAPDLRGYNLSSKPRCVRDYHLEPLVADVIGLIDQQPNRRAALVGHDWGGILAWYAAMWHSERVEKLVILNAPHPLAYLRELSRSTQLLRSWYVLLFQLPWIPEALFRGNDFALGRRFFAAGPARRSAQPAADVAMYVQAIARPGALTSAINYYRASGRRGPGAVRRLARPIRLSTLLIWGDRDSALVPGLADGLEPWVDPLQVERLSTASHWVQCDEPERVNRMLIEFLA